MNAKANVGVIIKKSLRVSFSFYDYKYFTLENTSYKNSVTVTIELDTYFV